MRTYLVGDAGFPPDTAVMIIVCSDQHSRQFWTGPSTDVVCNCLGFEFLARGVYFRALMGHNLPPNALEVNCASPYGRILHGHCRDMTTEKLQVLAAFPS
jgi:hypothetical protein